MYQQHRTRTAFVRTASAFDLVRRAVRLAAFLCCTAALLLLSAGTAVAAGIVVDGGGDAGAGCTLREAIASANTDTSVGDCTAGSGADTITFSVPPASTITLAGSQLNLTSTLTIDGGGVITVSADNASRVFNISSSGVVTLTGITIQSGNSDFGGGISNAGVLLVESSTVASNTASSYGGGVYNLGILTLSASTVASNTANTAAGDGGGISNLSGGRVTIDASTIVSNTARDGGGVYNTGSGSVISMTAGSLVQSNSAGRNGGGIYNGSAGNVTLLASSVVSNSAGNGGGVYSEVALHLTDGIVHSNQATGSGGGLYAESTLGMTNTQLISNTANFWGGGVYAFGAVTAVDSRFENNQSTNGGGGLFAWSTLVMTNTQLISNTTNSVGGGAYVDGATTAADSRFERNRSTSGGGGGLYSGGSMLLTNTHFLSNTASMRGGGVIANSASTIVNSRFENNQSTNGGGIYVQTGVQVEGALFLHNRASGNGGAIYFDGLGSGASTEQMVNVLMAGNRANGQGDAIYARHENNDDTLTILYTTIASPTLAGGAAVVLEQGTAHITDTIIVSHTTGIQRTGGVTVTQDYNLFFGNTNNTVGTVGGGTNSVSGDPAFLDPAADDYQLTAASAAIDRGVDAGVTTDFFGDPRPQGAGFDIGYDESPYIGNFACYATPNDGATLFASDDAQAVRNAVTAASAGGTVKIAGYCAGVAVQGGITQTVYISQPLTLAGGYTTTNWLAAADPVANPTTLDALAQGRVIYASAAVTVTDMSVQNGHWAIGGENGGGAYFGGAAVLSGTHVLSSTSGSWGGGAFFAGAATVNGGSFRNNQSADWGGGFFANTSLTMTGTQVLGNTKPGSGGAGAGGFALGYATVVDALFQDNLSFAGTGGLYAFSGAIVTGTRFINNQALNGGAGALYLPNGNSRIVNALFAGNFASNPGSAMAIETTGQVEIIHTTTASPTLGAGTAIVVSNGTTYITNSIVASYTVGLEQNGGFLGEDYNLFSGNGANLAGSITSGGNSVTGAAAFFDTTHYTLTAASAAIDRGVDMGVATDFFGDPRPQGAGFDIGYDESPFIGNFACYATPNNGATLFASDDAQAVRNAVTAASAGGTVKIAGYCAGAVFDSGDTQVARIDKTLTVAGGYTTTNWITSDPTANPTTLDALGGGHVLLITGAISATVENLRLTGGSSTDGGGVYNSAATVTITNSQVYSNSATNGGGVYNVNSGSVTLSASSVVSNSASFAGGGIANIGPAVITVTNGSLVQANQANYGGGGFWNQSGGIATIDASQIVDNVATGVGGGGFGAGIVNIAGGQISLDASSVVSNSASSNGGGIYNQDSDSDVTLSASSVLSNSAGSNGGGIYITGSGSAITVTDSTLVQGNSASVDGGGIYNYSGAVAIDASFVLSNTSGADGGGVTNWINGALSVTNGSRIAGNRAARGGGVWTGDGSTATIALSQILSNTVTGDGGGVFNTAGALILQDGSRVDSNAATSGAGLWNGDGGQVTLAAASVATNTASSNGAGLYNSGSGSAITVTNGSTVRTNTATGNGGGVFNTAGAVSVQDSRVEANGAASGGGLWNQDGGQVTLAAAAVATNTASSSGGGLYNSDSGSAITMTNGSTVRANTAAGNGGGVFNTAGAVSVQDSRVDSNGAASGGGLWNQSGGQVTIAAASVATNTASSNGGAIFSMNSGSSVTVTNNALLQGNTAQTGGGLYNTDNAVAAFTGATTIQANTAISYGGGITNLSGQVTVDGSTLRGNNAEQGGAIFNQFAGSGITLTNSTLLQENSATRLGGGIINLDGAWASIQASSILSNTAYEGAGVYNEDAGSLITLTGGSLVQGNRGIGEESAGGGVYNVLSGTVTITGNTMLVANQADFGGGIFNGTEGSITVESSVIRANVAITSGGGVYNTRSGTVAIAGSHLHENAAQQGFGGAIRNITGTVTVNGSELLTNTAANGFGGAVANGVSDGAPLGASLYVTASTLLNNSAGVSGALHQLGGRSSVTASCIVQNSDTAVAYSGGTAPITATGNWWGHPSGPSGAGPGVGDSVSTLVDFSGFLNAAILGCPTFADAEMAIAKSVEPALAAPGQAITYTLTFSNTGARFARSVVISDSIPLSVTITGITSSTVGSGVLITQTSGGPLPSMGGDFAWTVGDGDGDLDPGESGIITLTGVLAGDAAPGLVITNTATITASGDSTAGNNSSSAVLTVARLLVYPAQPGVAPNGSVTISATLTPVQAGVTVNFTVVPPGGGGLDNASAQTDANGVATVLYTASAITEVVQIEGVVAAAPEVRDRGIVYVAAATTAGGIATSASGDYTVGNLSPNFIQIVKTGAGTPPMGWAEFGGNPCPAAAPGTRVVSPYVDAMVDDTTGVEAIVVTLKYTDTQFAAQHTLYWCNLGVWQQVTETVSIDAVLETLTFTITGETTPALFQLAGTPLAGVGFVPTAATVDDFVASAQGERVSLTWQTLNEIGLYGFHLYRGLDAAGPGDRITGDPVAAQGAGGLEGFAYAYDDFTPQPAETPVYYWLEELHGDGTYRHGPLRVGGAGSLRIFLPAIRQGAAPAADVDVAPVGTAPVETAPEGLAPGMYLPLIEQRAALP